MPPFRLLLFPIQISAGKLLPCSCLCLPRHASAVQVSWHSASPAFGSRAPFGAFLLLFFSALPAFSFLQAPFASLALLRAFFLTLLLSFFLLLFFSALPALAYLFPASAFPSAALSAFFPLQSYRFQSCAIFFFPFSFFHLLIFF